jgi:hypothetical protein
LPGLKYAWIQVAKVTESQTDSSDALLAESLALWRKQIHYSKTSINLNKKLVLHLDDGRMVNADTKEYATTGKSRKLGTVHPLVRRNL